MSFDPKRIGRKIYGILAPPRLSRNNNLYLPEELARADGLKVPLYDQHEDFEIGQDGRPTGRILAKEARGVLTLVWNRVLQRLEYVGEVWDRALQKLISSGQRPHVSLAAEPRHFEVYRGHNVPLDMQFFSVATVKNPGIPETTVTMESMLETYMDMAAPVVLESANGTASMILLEFDTESLAATEDDLSSDDRDDLRGSQFAYIDPTTGDRKLPINDAPHVRNALARFNQTDFHSDSAKSAALAKIHAAAKRFGINVSENGTQCPHGFVGGEGCPQCNIPQGYSNLTPMRGVGNQRSGLPGVTGTQNLTPMQGTGQNAPKGVPDPVVRPVVSPTGQDQQILPRDLIPKGTVDNPNATSHGVGRESLEANKNDTADAGSVMASTPVSEEERADVSSANPKKFGAQPAATPHDAEPKQIGPMHTGFERKIDDIGTTTSNPNRMPTISAREEEDHLPGEKSGAKPPMDDGDDEDEVKEAATYGFSKEEFSDLKSSFSRKEWPGKWESFKSIMRTNPRLKEYVKKNRLESSGVLAQRSISQQRESREGGQNVVSTAQAAGRYVVNGVDLSFPDIEMHLDNLAMSARTGDVKHMYSRVPFLNPPRVGKASGLGPRLEFADQIEAWQEQKRQFVSEAIATTTSGAAMAVDGAVPALVVPTNLAALLRDTVYFQQIQQGSNIARFQTITVPAAGALTENTEPSQATQTLATVNIQPGPRGVEQQISFEADRKILGPIMEGVILSFRVSELYDEDDLLLGASQAFESGVVTGTGQLYNTANQIFGAGRASEGTVISTDTFALSTLTDAQEIMTNQGYSPDNGVAVLHPAQYRKLLQDSNVNRLISFGPNTTPGQSYVAQGVIPELLGFEIRRSTLMATGTGSASITTYHGWAYKKGLTAGMAASRDVMIETFRDIRTNSTWVKGHWDLKAGLLQPNSLIEMVTA